MIVLQSTRQTAMFAIYKALTRGAAALDSAEIRDLWHITGLRQSDCQIAIDEMMRNHFLRASAPTPQMLLELTDAGLQEFHRPRTRRSIRLTDWLTLLRLQWRRRRNESAVPRKRGRRSDDGVATTSEPRTPV